jgi:hypothetical protein
MTNKAAAMTGRALALTRAVLGLPDPRIAPAVALQDSDDEQHESPA